MTFTRAWSSASWTVPSMGTIMTSHYPPQLGLIERKRESSHFRPRERRKQIRYTLDPGTRTMAGMLRNAGFHTAAFVNQPFINSHDGFMQGFDEWCYPVSNLEVAWHNPAEPAPHTSLPAGVELGQADGPIVDAFIEWLDGVGDEPVFVWLHLLRPHWPYLPPPEYMKGHGENWAQTTSASVRYDAEIRASDSDLTRALEAIDRRIGLDDCVVVFTSDHGEAFGEHDAIEHGHSLHWEVTRVPLILTAPQLPAGRRVDVQVRAADILPTVLELASVPVDSTAGIEGESLLPTVASGGADRPVYQEGMLYEGSERSLIADGYRLLYEKQDGERYSLFDLTGDPHEQTDIAESDPERVEAMRRRMNALRKRFLIDFRERTVHTANRSSGKDEDQDKESQRVMRSLKSLGYIK